MPARRAPLECLVGDALVRRMHIDDDQTHAGSGQHVDAMQLGQRESPRMFTALPSSTRVRCDAPGSAAGRNWRLPRRRRLPLQGCRAATLRDAQRHAGLLRRLGMTLGDGGLRSPPSSPFADRLGQHPCRVRNRNHEPVVTREIGPHVGRMHVDIDQCRGARSRKAQGRMATVQHVLVMPGAPRVRTSLSRTMRRLT